MAQMTKAAATAALVAKGIVPRGLTRAEAAAYVGLSDRAFRDRVTAGKLPGAHPATGRWDRAAIDHAIGGAASDAVKTTPKAMRDAIEAAIDSI